MQLVSIIFYFIRELLFDSKKEYDFRSPQFDPRKMIFFVLTAISICVNIFLIGRVVTIAHESVKDSDKIRELSEEISKLEAEQELDKQTIKTLQSYLSPGRRSEKNKPTGSLDESRAILLSKP